MGAGDAEWLCLYTLLIEAVKEPAMTDSHIMNSNMIHMVAGCLGCMMERFGASISRFAMEATHPLDGGQHARKVIPNFALFALYLVEGDRDIHGNLTLPIKLGMIGLCTSVGHLTTSDPLCSSQFGVTSLLNRLQPVARPLHNRDSLVDMEEVPSLDSLIVDAFSTSHETGIALKKNSGAKERSQGQHKSKNFIVVLLPSSPRISPSSLPRTSLSLSISPYAVVRTSLRSTPFSETGEKRTLLSILRHPLSLSIIASSLHMPTLDSFPVEIVLVVHLDVYGFCRGPFIFNEHGHTNEPLHKPIGQQNGVFIQFPLKQEPDDESPEIEGLILVNNEHLKAFLASNKYVPIFCSYQLKNIQFGRGEVLVKKIASVVDFEGGPLVSQENSRSRIRPILRRSERSREKFHIHRVSLSHHNIATSRGRRSISAIRRGTFSLPCHTNLARLDSVERMLSKLPCQARRSGCLPVAASRAHTSASPSLYLVIDSPFQVSKPPDS
ncbi:hypothetical protein VNO77_03375 [Canavalia gladiata]|uniref:Uncharacterized protein n=1 Tax=Canavalia gladiata TaxID=3824 RepID=A0AAN9R3T8_CANGL